MHRIQTLSSVGLLALATTLWAADEPRPATSSAPAPAYRVWPSKPPADCPFKKSDQIADLAFTGRHAEYTGADTWYPTWAADGNLYSPFTDGDVPDSVTKVITGSNSIGPKATTAHAKIVGDDPLNLQIVEAGKYPSDPAPYGGRYPCGSLVYNGVWYYGTYCLTNEAGSLEALVTTPSGVYNWGILGPFVGFRTSKDYGKTWTQTPHTPSKPLFGEPARFGGPVKIGSPHFVDFGKNMEHSPDGKAYLVGQGATEPDPKPRMANLSWGTGDQIYFIRVTPSVENINDASKYEFFAGHNDKDEPVWTHDFAAIKPLVDWNNHCGCVTMTYNPGLRKYLMCITDAWPTVDTTDTYILESDRITGPWKMATYMARFGDQAYFVSFPSKFISRDGRTLWLCYAANYLDSPSGAKRRSDPPGGRYGMCLQEVRLLGPS